LRAGPRLLKGPAQPIGLNKATRFCHESIQAHSKQRCAAR
jgi:hypothetical protein